VDSRIVLLSSAGITTEPFPVKVWIFLDRVNPAIIIIAREFSSVIFSELTTFLPSYRRDGIMVQKSTTAAVATTTKEQAMANARKYFNHLELQEASKRSSQPMNSPTAPPSQEKHFREREPPSIIHVKRSNVNETKFKARKYYEALLTKEKMKQGRFTKPNVTWGTVRTSAFVPPTAQGMGTQRTRPTTFVGSERTEPINMNVLRLNIKEKDRTQQFYETLVTNEEKKRQSSLRRETSIDWRHHSHSPSVIASPSNETLATNPFAAQRTPPNPNAEAEKELPIEHVSTKHGSPLQRLNVESVQQQPATFQQERKGIPGQSKTCRYRQLIIDGLAIFIACFLEKNLGMYVCNFAGNILQHYAFQVYRFVMKCGSIALQTFLVSVVALCVVRCGRYILNHKFTTSGLLQVQLQKDITTLRDLAYMELMSQPEVGVTMVSLRDLVLSRYFDDDSSARANFPPRTTSEYKKTYWENVVWPNVAQILNHEPNILKTKMRVGKEMVTIWKWTEETSSVGIPKKRKVSCFDE
jgi:hypothetical protein